MVLSGGVLGHLGVSVCLLLVTLHISAVDVVGPVVVSPVLPLLLGKREYSNFEVKVSLHQKNSM